MKQKRLLKPAILRAILAIGFIALFTAGLSAALENGTVVMISIIIALTTAVIGMNEEFKKEDRMERHAK